MHNVYKAPPCLLCEGQTKLLYPSNVTTNKGIESEEFACTSSHLAIHDDIFLCKSCKLARSVPNCNISEIEELYRSVEDHDYLLSEEERRRDFRDAIKQMERHQFIDSPGSLLEIGSSYGLFLDEAQQAGWKVEGIEPSHLAAQAATEKGLDVFNGMLNDYNPGEKRFDVVASWDVWEHLDDPLRALEQAHALLRPGGLLVITTVNMGGVMAKLMRGRWPWFMRMHLHYFTRKSLTAMARRAGFQVLKLSTQPKTLKLGYLLSRSHRLFGPFGKTAFRLAQTLNLLDHPLRINTGDILLIEARRMEAELS